MANLNVKAISQFVPAEDIELSKKFYFGLGCKLNYESGKFNQLELSGCRFYLQDFYVKEYADNYMMHFSVEDIEAWYKHVLKLIEGFPTSDRGLPKVLGPPQAESSGARSFQLRRPVCTGPVCTGHDAGLHVPGCAGRDADPRSPATQGGVRCFHRIAGIQ